MKRRNLVHRMNFAITKNYERNNLKTLHPENVASSFQEILDWDKVPEN
jgi:hypothetical protein